MDTTADSRRDQAWAMIDEEKKRDLLVRRVSYIAWGVTTAILLLFTAIVALEAVQMLELQRAGVVPVGTFVQVIKPFIAVIGTISFLVAIMATVGIFLRLRTASLSEIQLRLAALEEILLEREG